MSTVSGSVTVSDVETSPISEDVNRSLDNSVVYRCVGCGEPIDGPGIFVPDSLMVLTPGVRYSLREFLTKDTRAYHPHHAPKE